MANSQRQLLTALAVALGVAIAGCSSSGKVASSSGADGKYYKDDRPPDRLDFDPLSVPDAVPQVEPLSRYGNKPYTALGKGFKPLASSHNFQQRGVASWYGKRYHGNRTSSGETYDMFAMTAAHPTLPLPTYVRVTNENNQRSVVVKVNDRGPFLSNRVIDLSYTAAYKLGYVNNGTAPVSIQALDPKSYQANAISSTSNTSVVTVTDNSVAQTSVAAVPQSVVVGSNHSGSNSNSDSNSLPATNDAQGVTHVAGVYLQLGAFADRLNAAKMLTSFSERVDQGSIVGGLEGAPNLHENANKTRVVLGPYNDTLALERDKLRLQRAGIATFRVELD